MDIRQPSRAVLADLRADDAMLAAKQWLQMEDMSVLCILKKCGFVSGSFPLIHEEHIEDAVHSARSADFGLLEHRVQVQRLEERKNMHRRNHFRTGQDRGVNMRTSCRFDTHMNKGGLSAPEQESVRTCLRSGEPLTVCFLSPTKRLRAIMAILNLTDLPQDWRILDLSQECCEASLTFDELLNIAREHESGLADNKESAIEGVRLLLRSLVRSGLLQCCTHISTQDPESSVETYRLNQFKDPSEISKSHILENQPDMKAHAEKMKEILSSKQRDSCTQTEPLESAIEIMQHAFKVLGATPSLSWQKSLATDLLNMYPQQHLVWFCVVGMVLLALWVPEFLFVFLNFFFGAFGSSLDTAFSAKAIARPAAKTAERCED